MPTDLAVTPRKETPCMAHVYFRQIHLISDFTPCHCGNQPMTTVKFQNHFHQRVTRDEKSWYPTSLVPVFGGILDVVDSVRSLCCSQLCSHAACRRLQAGTELWLLSTWVRPDWEPTAHRFRAASLDGSTVHVTGIVRQQFYFAASRRDSKNKLICQITVFITPFEQQLSNI